MTERVPLRTVGATIGFGLVGASAASLAVLWGLSWSGAGAAVTTAMSDHLVAEAGLVGEHLRAVPVEVLVKLGEGHASEAVSKDLDGLLAASGLHDAAVLGPDGAVLGSGGTWLPAAAERDLVARAASGTPVSGALYRGEDGALYLTAYSPLVGHPGWVVAVEGSATLGAVDALGRRQAVASGVVVGVVALVGAGLAALIARPLRSLEAALQEVVPGDPPGRLVPGGPREVWRVTTAAQGLLSAIRDRDREVARAHRDQVEQLTRLAAEVAHEVRNPLNALALSIDRLERLEDPARRREVADRLRAQVGELDAITSRLVDLTRPLHPVPQAVDLGALLARLSVEVDLPVTGVPSSAEAVVDPTFAAEILRNLLLNARQAGARSATVRLSARAVELEDDGPGVPEPDRIFDWFHTTRAQGSGLGLPTARRMAEAMGGSLVCVRDRPATFRWTLPVEPP